MKRNIEAAEQRMTRYKNPLPYPQVVRVWTDTRFETFTFAPGEEREIPSQYDFAVHHVHDGQIIGGDAPQLINMARPDLKLAGYLDTEAQKREAAKAALVAAQLDKQKAEQEAMLAAARAVEAEAEAKRAQVAQPSSVPEVKPTDKK